jgi:3-hydroxybutyryl-CoA dehydrogenase
VIEKAKEYIGSLLNRSVEKGYIQSEHRDLVNQNPKYTTQLQEAVERTDMVIEAV